MLWDDRTHKKEFILKVKVSFETIKRVIKLLKKKFKNV